MDAPESPVFDDTSVAPAMSLGARLGNIFVSPSEVFDDVKASPPQAANWLVPMALAIIVGIIYSLVVFSQPGVLQRIKDAQDRKFQQLVDTGKLTPQQVDAQQAAVARFMSPAIFKVFGIIGFLVTLPVMLFLVAFIIWLLGTKGFSGDFEYMKSVESVGLAGMISVPGWVVSMLLAVIYGDTLMTPGLVLLVPHFDPTNKVHLILSALDVVSLWYVAVLAIALARLSGGAFWKSALWGYGLWAFFRVGLILAFGGK